MKRWISVLVIACCLLTACRAAATPRDRTGFALDTVVGITVYRSEDDAAVDACFDELERLEQLLSATRDGSDIDRINQANGASVDVSAETAR